MLDSSSMKWIIRITKLDVPNWLLTEFKLLTELELLTELKLEAEFLSHRKLLLDDPFTQPWEILSEATPSRAPNITVKTKVPPWCEMMMTSRPNFDGGRVRA